MTLPSYQHELAIPYPPQLEAEVRAEIRNLSAWSYAAHHSQFSLRVEHLRDYDHYLEIMSHPMGKQYFWENILQRLYHGDIIHVVCNLQMFTVMVTTRHLGYARHENSLQHVRFLLVQKSERVNWG